MYLQLASVEVLLLIRVQGNPKNKRKKIHLNAITGRCNKPGLTRPEAMPHLQLTQAHHHPVPAPALGVVGQVEILRGVQPLVPSVAPLRGVTWGKVPRLVPRLVVCSVVQDVPAGKKKSNAGRNISAKSKHNNNGVRKVGLHLSRSAPNGLSLSSTRSREQDGND